MPQNETQKKRAVKPEEQRPVIADNAVSDYSWGSLPLAIQLIVPLAIITLIIGRRGFGIRTYPVLDTYVSLICPSFKQKQRLLKWMSNRIPHMPNKISEYWKDGSLLCTLINTAVPGACPNPQRHWHQPPSHGQALAFKYLGVTPMLNEDHFKERTLNSQTEKSFFKYLLAVQDAIAKLDAKENAELKYTWKYIPRGMGLFTGEKDRPSTFYIYPNSRLKKMQNVLVSVKGPYGSYGTQTISAQSIHKSLAMVQKVQKDVRREQKKLTVPGKAQRSFFRSLSIDLGPFANIICNRRSAGEIQIKVEIEEGRAKVSFTPQHTGVYELCLTTDGEHLMGSPFNIRVAKNETNSGEPKQRKGKKVTGKIISKCITFINESVRMIDNNVTLRAASTNVLCKVDEASEISVSYRCETNTLNEEKEGKEGMRGVTPEEVQDVVSESMDTPLNDEDDEVVQNSSLVNSNEQRSSREDAFVNSTEEKRVEDLSHHDLESTTEVEDFYKHEEEEQRRYHKNLDKSVKRFLDLKSNVEFENLHNRKTSARNLKRDPKSNAEFEALYKKYVKNETEDARQNLEVNSELRLLKKVSNIRAVRQMFESYLPSNPDLITCHSQKRPKAASPVSRGIEQEASRCSAEDTTRPSLDGAASSPEKPKRNVDVTDEVGEISVLEIRARFENAGATRRNNHDVDLLKETTTSPLKEIKRHLAASLPNLIVNDLSNSLEDMPMNFQERHQFWANLIQPPSRVLEEKKKTTNSKKVSRSTYSLELQVSTDVEEEEEEEVFPSLKDRKNSYLGNFGNPRPPLIKQQNCDRAFEKGEAVSLSKCKPSRAPPVNQPPEENDFADAMRRRFEKSREYFKSLEVLPTLRKSDGMTRRSSLDNRTSTVRARFSLDNLYRDVMSEKIRMSSFKGSPNRCAVAETLASISSKASSFDGEENAETVAEGNDLDLKYFQMMKKKTRERKSVRSLFDINY